MKFPATPGMARALVVLASVSLPAPSVRADPQLSSWITGICTKYARIYTSAANRTAGVSATSWTGQTLPTYCGVHEINYSATWVYIRNTGLGGHVMGPWNNPNLPKNQGTSTSVYRFPRTPSIPGTKTLTALGAIGFFVDGVAVYDTSDGFSYSTSNARDATPNGGFNGDGIWRRDAWALEFNSFDYAYAHNPQSGQYHSHADPIAARYLVGDNVNYDSSSKQYTVNTSNSAPNHSPIVGWMRDGLPIYGPYGYDGGSTGATGAAIIGGGAVLAVNVTNGGTLYQNPPLVTFTGGGGSGAAATAVLTSGVVTGISMSNGGSGYTSAPTVTLGGVRRMVSGYVLRDGTNNTTNLNATGRTTLPAWAAAAQNHSTMLAAGEYGPTTTYTSGTGMTFLTYVLGHYAEDYDYLGDLGYTQGSRSNAGGVFFDMNKYNTRFCVTPEFPGGTWAYFITILANGTPWYPYSCSRWYFGSPTGGASTATVMNADTPLTQYFKGSAFSVETWTTTPVSLPGTNVTLTWSAVEGGTYTVQASNDLSNWSPLNPAVTATSNTASATETNGGLSNPGRFYKITRTSLATYDSNGY